MKFTPLRTTDVWDDTSSAPHAPPPCAKEMAWPATVTVASRGLTVLAETRTRTAPLLDPKLPDSTVNHPGALLKAFQLHPVLSVVTATVAAPPTSSKEKCDGLTANEQVGIWAA